MATARRKYSVPPFVIEHADSLQATRENAGLSRTEVAGRTGISYGNISQYERGYSFPNKQNYNKLAKFFDWEEWD